VRKSWGLLRSRAHRLLIAAAMLSVCPVWGQLPGAAPEGAATITDMIGRVDVLRDSAKWALNTGDWVKPGQMIVTGPDGWALFRLADNSTFEVFPNSQVSFRANRSEWKDLLEVLLGNIKVHIQKLGGQPNPNKVRTPTALISVRGTIFDVRVEDDGDTTMVMVEEGLVDVQHLLLPGKVVQLRQGESVQVFKTVPLAQNRIDRGTAAGVIFRGAMQGVYDILLGRRASGGGVSAPTAGGGSTGVGDQKASDPPPPPPPPPTSVPPPPPGQ
jgi:ferric-dicitrate binding protein FerR (iron transport regulator)